MLTKYKNEIIKTQYYATIMAFIYIIILFVYEMITEVRPEFISGHITIGEIIELFISASIMCGMLLGAVLLTKKEKIFGGVLPIIVGMLFLLSDSIISLIVMFILMEMSILYLITLYKNKNDKKFRRSIIISIIFVIIIGICGYVVYNEENSIEIGDNKHKNTFIVDLSEVDMNKPLPGVAAFNPQKLATISETKEFKMSWDDCKITVIYKNNNLEVLNSCAPEEKQKYENIDKVFYDSAVNCVSSNLFDTIELFVFKDKKIYFLTPGNTGFRIIKFNNQNNYESIYSGYEFGGTACGNYNAKFGKTADGTYYYLGTSKNKDYNNGDKYIDTDYWDYTSDKVYIKTNRKFKLNDSEGKAKVILYREADGGHPSPLIIINENNLVMADNVKQNKVKRIIVENNENIILEFEDDTYLEYGFYMDITY